jgi:hypothetical protein
VLNVASPIIRPSAPFQSEGVLFGKLGIFSGLQRVLLMPRAVGLPHGRSSPLRMQMLSLSFL